LDIGDGAFDLLFALYKEQREQWGANQYLTRAGEISSASRLEAFLAAIGAVETEILVQKEKDEAVYVKKRRRWDRRDGKGQGPSDSQLAAAEAEKQGDYLSMIQSLMAKHNLNDTAESEGEEDEDSSSPFVAGWTPVRAGEKDFKGRYYFEKLRLTPANVDEHWNMRKSYIEGLMWCLAYYYRGCISWGWFYPYHYGE
jgi:5'-3' exonuclease